MRPALGGGLAEEGRGGGPDFRIPLSSGPAFLSTKGKRVEGKRTLSPLSSGPLSSGPMERVEGKRVEGLILLLAYNMLITKF